MKCLFSCRGKVAVVTGPAGRLGPVWVSALLDAGADVVMLAQDGTSDQPEVRALCKAGATLLPIDVNDERRLRSVRELILRDYGAVDVLVASAGIDHRPDPGQPPVRMDGLRSADIDSILSTNVKGTMLTVSVIGGAMLAAGRGSVIVIGSQYASLAPRPALYSHLPPVGEFVKNPVYGASKAALVQIVRHFAAEWGRHGIRVNALSPGGIAGGQDDRFRAKFTAEVPLARMGELDDLIGPLLFLASDATSYVTGINLVVDGGYGVW